MSVRREAEMIIGLGGVWLGMALIFSCRGPRGPRPWRLCRFSVHLFWRFFRLFLLGLRFRLGRRFDFFQPHSVAAHGKFLSVDIDIPEDPGYRLQRDLEEQEFYMVPVFFDIRRDGLDAGKACRLIFKID